MIRKTVDAIITENKVIEQPDTQKVAGFMQSCGARPILRARRGIRGLMIVDGNDCTDVEKNCRVENFTKVHNAEALNPTLIAYIGPSPTFTIQGTVLAA